MLRWLLDVSGVADQDGRWYGFWSGVGGNLGDVTLVVGLIAYLRRHNCHVRWCPRMSKHPLHGTPYVVCRRHHPDVPEDGLDAADVR